MSIRIGKSELIRIFVIEIVFFQPILEKYFYIFSCVDELFSLAIFIYGICLFLRNGRGKLELQLFLFWLSLLAYNFLGILSSYHSGYRTIYISMISQFLANKFFLTLFGAWAILSFGFVNKEAFFTSKIKNVIRGDIVILAIWQIIALYNKLIPMVGDNELCADIIAGLSACIITWKGKKDYIYIIFIFLALLFNTSFKAYGAIALILMIYVWCIKKKKKMRIRDLIIVGLAMTVFGWDEVKYYLVEGVSNSAPRAMLLKYGMDLAIRLFPFGTGLGTFGSYYAAKLYSPVYIAFGWENHFTLGRDKSYFLNDIFWPTVYTETGLVGFAAFMIAMVLIYLLIARVYRNNYKVYAIGLIVMGYMFLASFTSTSFAHPSAVILAFILSYVIGKDDKLVLKKGNNKGFLYVCDKT